MNDGFNIYVEQLRSGNSEKISEAFAPDFLDVHEKELAFNDPVKVSGEAYLAEDNLILHLEISTFASIPCRICNEPVKVPLQLQKFYHSEPLDVIKSGVYNMMPLLREATLLETPAFAECEQGKCPKRKEFEKYIKKTENSEKEEGYHPFDDLKLE